MEVFFYLLIIGCLLFLALLWGLVWAIKDGQFKDLDTPPEKILWKDQQSD